MSHGVVAALCLGALLGAGLVVLTATQDDGPARSSVTAVAADDEPETGSSERRSAQHGHGLPHRFGPPPWVRGGRGAPPWVGRRWDEPGRVGRPGTPSWDWKQSWQDLTEQERDELMAHLARTHAAGVRRRAGCVEDSGDPSSCARPTPPGQATKEQVR